MTRFFARATAEQMPEEVQAFAVDPARVEGHARCVECHAAEVRAWQASRHAAHAFDVLRSEPSARAYAEELGIRPDEIISGSLCLRCHATPKLDDRGHVSMLAGISCESCHGGAGGADGWLNLHAVYGAPGTRREEETSEHYAQRRAACQRAGQRRSNDLYELAKRCFDCHVVADEALAEAGHDHGHNFELATKLFGEVRHNVFLNRSHNADVATLWTDKLRHGAGRTAAGRKRIVFLVGQLVDLEISFHRLAQATGDGTFSDLLIERIRGAFDRLTKDVPEQLVDAELPEIKQLVTVIKPTVEQLDLRGFTAANRPGYREASAAASAAARRCAKRDGNRLQALDGLGLISAAPTARVFQPE